MNDDPSEQAAESAQRAADARHQGETKPQAHLIVDTTHPTTPRRTPQWRPGLHPVRDLTAVRAYVRMAEYRCNVTEYDY
jgi:hypothetical protein